MYIYIRERERERERERPWRPLNPPGGSDEVQGAEDALVPDLCDARSRDCGPFRSWVEGLSGWSSSDYT